MKVVVSKPIVIKRVNNKVIIKTDGRKPSDNTNQVTIHCVSQEKYERIKFDRK